MPTDKEREAALNEACNYIKVCEKSGHPQVTLENLTLVVNKALEAAEKVRIDEV